MNWKPTCSECRVRCERSDFYFDEGMCWDCFYYIKSAVVIELDKENHLLHPQLDDMTKILENAKEFVGMCYDCYHQNKRYNSRGE